MQTIKAPQLISCGVLVIKKSHFHLKRTKTLDVIFSKTDDVNGLLTLKISDNDLKPAISKKLKELGAKAQIKGFRPGKVPAQLIEKMYGPSIKTDVLNETIDKTINSYIKDNNLDILGQPLSSLDSPEIDWNQATDYEFKFDLGLVPDITLPDLKNLTISTFRPQVDEERINEMVANVQKQFGTTFTPDASDLTDIIYGSLANQDGTWSKDVSIPVNKIAEKAQSQFLGVSKSSVIEFDLASAIDAHELRHITGLSKEEISEISGNYTLTVKNINRTAQAEVNVELFEKVFPKQEIQDEEAFRARIATELEKGAAQDAHYFKEQSMKQSLIKGTSLTLPATFLKRWYLAQKDNKLTEADFDKEWPAYERDLKWSIIRNKVGSQAEIKIERVDVEQYTAGMLARQFAQYGMGDVDPEMMIDYAQNYLSAEKGKNMMEMYEQTYLSQVVNHIMSQIIVVEESISSHDFHHKMHDLEDGWNA
jgi:trigger factor